MKRLTLICGHYGSGKTNIALNYALSLKREEGAVTVADLDIVNPYFRTKDSRTELEEAGIRLICSEYANTNVDIPALPPELYSITHDKNHRVVLDIGGDDRGAYALGRFVDAIKAENNYSMVFVANCYRPLTRDVDSTIEIMREIENACKLNFTCIVNNSHLGEYTTAETVTDSFPYIEELCKKTGLPLFMHTAVKEVADKLTGVPVMAMTLQKKYFDIPKV